MVIVNTSEKIFIQNGVNTEAIAKSCIRRIRKNKKEGKIYIFYDDPSQGQGAVVEFKFADVTSPVTADFNALFDVIDEYTDSGRKYIIKTVVFPIAGANARIELGDFAGYQSISVEIDYSGLDANDSIVKLQQKASVLSSAYVDIPELTIVLDGAGGIGIDILQDDAFGSGLLAAYFTKTSVTLGQIIFRVIAHK